ncbi:MAG: hypothetical protein AB1664_01160 [Thermodesulfobacteriota bacterium]
MKSTVARWRDDPRMKHNINPSHEGVVRAFKSFRNLLRKYDPRIVFGHCGELLAQIDRVGLSQDAPPYPWELLLLMKWALLYGDLAARKEARSDVIEKLLNRLRDCYRAALVPESEIGRYLIHRKYAFLQFPYRLRETWSRFARQSLLFGDLQLSHPIRLDFQRVTGFDVNDYVELALCTLALLDDCPKGQLAHVREEQFSTMGSSYDADAVRTFLSLFSCDVNELQAYLLELDHKYCPRLEHELYEESPFKRYPMVRKGKVYVPLSRSLLGVSLQDFIYDTLRALDSQRFGNLFGPIFQQYVNKVVNESRLPYLNEDQLKELVGEKGGIVDGLVVIDDTNVLIEAKGVEMRYLGRVTDDADQLQSAHYLLVNAIRQAYGTVRKLGQKGRNGQIQLGNSQLPHLIIITYKPFYIGNGMIFYKAIARQKLDAILKSLGGEVLIPFENMHFISIREFEFLMEAVRTGQVGLRESLCHAADVEAREDARKFMFYRHLQDLGVKPGTPPYMLSEYNKIMGRLTPKIKKTEQ